MRSARSSTVPWAVHPDTCGHVTTVLTGWVEPSSRTPARSTTNTGTCRRGPPSTTTNRTCRSRGSTPALLQLPQALVEAGGVPGETLLQVPTVLVESGGGHPPPSTCRPGAAHYPASLLPQVVTANLLPKLSPPGSLPRADPPMTSSPPCPSHNIPMPLFSPPRPRLSGL